MQVTHTTAVVVGSNSYLSTLLMFNVQQCMYFKERGVSHDPTFPVRSLYNAVLPNKP